MNHITETQTDRDCYNDVIHVWDTGSGLWVPVHQMVERFREPQQRKVAFFFSSERRDFVATCPNQRCLGKKRTLFISNCMGRISMGTWPGDSATTMGIIYSDQLGMGKLFN